MNILCFWQMGFFRRRYREIIEAERNRKDSDDSWDWMEKNHWDTCWQRWWGGPCAAKEISGSGHDEFNGTGLLFSPAVLVAPGPSSLPYVEEEEIFSIFSGDLICFWGGSRWQRGLPEDDELRQFAAGGVEPPVKSPNVDTGGQQKPQGCVT